MEMGEGDGPEGGTRWRGPDGVAVRQLLIVIHVDDEDDHRPDGLGFYGGAIPADPRAVPGSRRDAAGPTLIVHHPSGTIIFGGAHRDGRQSHRGRRQHRTRAPDPERAAHSIDDAPA